MKRILPLIFILLITASGWGADTSDIIKPTPHKDSHATGGSDELTPADIGVPGYYNCTIPQPGTQYDNSVYITLDPKTDSAKTITDIEISCGTTAYDVDWDLMYADDDRSFANATIAQSVDTSSGVLSLTGQSIAIPQSKALYLRFNAAPNDNIERLSFKSIY